ncbi:MAG TPA: SRPBCC domain-containing protein [Fodinibius sp.]|nr:SRPBCC domain-containing protein [Fodinibius sp.]
MSSQNQFTAKSKEKPSLRIVRRFNVAPEVVFDAFTKPEAMRVWWTDNTTFDIDLRVGGRWTITRKDGDVTYTMTGEYQEVEPPHRLRHTIAMPEFSPNSDTITLNITAEGESGCQLIFVQSGKDIAAELEKLPPEGISESEKGWQQGFDLMAEAWKK